MMKCTVDKDPYAKWTDAQTKLLMSIYPGFKRKLDVGRIVSAKRMHEQIAKVLEDHGHCFTPVQVESKWKCLARTENNRKTKPMEIPTTKRSVLQVSSQNQISQPEEGSVVLDNEMVSQVVKQVGVARVPEEIMKLAKLKNAPSVVAVYNFDGTPSPSQEHRGPIIEHVSTATEDDEEDEDGVHLQGDEEENVHFSHPVLGSRQSARTVAEELANLREEVEKRQAAREITAHAKEQSRALRHQERMDMLNRILNKILEQESEETEK